MTADHGLLPVRWIGRSDVSIASTVINPNILPVRIAAGAMGDGLPARDLWLSPQHRVLVRSRIVARMTGKAEAPVAVKHLCTVPGITQTTIPREVTYLQIRLDRHEMVRAEGVWAETLLVGPQALRGMGRAAREELDLIFPGLVEGPRAAPRTIMAGTTARMMAQRHVKNGKALVDAD
jgi:hypothetical protein